MTMRLSINESVYVGDSLRIIFRYIDASHRAHFDVVQENAGDGIALGVGGAFVLSVSDVGHTSVDVDVVVPGYDISQTP